MFLTRSPDVRALRWWPAATAALLWALAAGGAALWWLHWPQPLRLLPQDASATPAAATADGGDLLRALGHTPAATATPDVQRRFQLVGVIASGSGTGSALLGVDGQPAQAFVRGQSVVEGWRLQAVSAQGVRLQASQGGATLELLLPERP